MVRVARQEMARTVAKVQKENAKEREARGDGGPKFQARQQLAKAKMSAPAGGSGTEVVKKKRYKPGVKALLEIRKYQKCTNPILRMTPFIRLVRDRGTLVVGARFGASSGLKEVRYKRVALEVLREMMETWMVRLLEDALLIAIHRKVQGVQTKDLLLTKRIRAGSGSTNFDYEDSVQTRGGQKK